MDKTNVLNERNFLFINNNREFPFREVGKPTTPQAQTLSVLLSEEVVSMLRGILELIDKVQLKCPLCRSPHIKVIAVTQEYVRCECKECEFRFSNDEIEG